MNYIELYTKQFPTSDRVIQTPSPPRWPKDWEWKLTFTQIFILFKKQFKFWIDKLLVHIIISRKLTDFKMEYQVNYRTVSVEEIEKFILDVLRNNQYNYTLATQKCMIVFGPDSRNKIFSSEIFKCHMRYKFAENSTKGVIYYYHNIPCIYIPTISGVHILPDLTGEWTEKLFHEPEYSTFGQRRYF